MRKSWMLITRSAAVVRAVLISETAGAKLAPGLFQWNHHG